MSWLKGIVTGEEPEPYRERPNASLVRDPSHPNRMVSNKPANRPFLAYKEYREKQNRVREEWLKRKKERDEKIARGEKVGPEEKDPTAQEEVGLLGLLKFILIVILCITLAGKFITGSFIWEYDGKWSRWRTYFPEQGQRLLSERLLAEFDGRVPGRPIYLAIDGDVYDVTKGKAYQPGGSYHIMAGVDAARAFGTGCFQTHRTHDLRGLNEDELRGVEHWKKFYLEHKDYFKVGKVIHPPIDPSSPIPEHCKPGRAAAEEGPKKSTPEGPQKAQMKAGSSGGDL